MVRETPLGNDGDFSHDGLFQRINAELANDLGNLLNRSIAMASKYCDGEVPPGPEDPQAQEVDAQLVALAERVAAGAAEHFEAYAPSRALETIWELVRATNKYIDTTAPYKLIKQEGAQRRVEEVVANFLEALRWISLLVAPVMPDKAAGDPPPAGAGFGRRRRPAAGLARRSGASCRLDSSCSGGRPSSPASTRTARPSCWRSGSARARKRATGRWTSKNKVGRRSSRRSSWRSSRRRRTTA